MASLSEFPVHSPSLEMHASPHGYSHDYSSSSSLYIPRDKRPLPLSQRSAQQQSRPDAQYIPAHNPSLLLPSISQMTRRQHRPSRVPLADSSPISARRMISSNIPSKTAQVTPYAWQEKERSSSRRFAAMSAGDRSSSYQTVRPDQQAYTNQDIRREFEMSHSGSEGRKAARKSEGLSQISSDTGDDQDQHDQYNSGHDDMQASETEDSEDTLCSDSSSDEDQEEPDALDHGNEEEDRDSRRPRHPTQVATLEPPEELLDAIRSLVEPVACMQAVGRLPFLRRTLRLGFLYHCRKAGVSTERAKLPKTVKVVFKRENFIHSSQIASYECPLCNLHDLFPNGKVLTRHLSLDHGEIGTRWFTIEGQVTLELTFTEEKAVDEHSHVQQDESELQSFVEEALQNPYGPTARAPFWPMKSEFGGPDITKRPPRLGGPRIYDLLNLLPMESFGVLSWVVIDREEEIFESDDILDEHKVMHALWARWIFLNRNAFIRDYFQGTKTFIDEYWKMIRLAAGWDALRYWLILLLASRYITGGNVADLLKHYEKWCDDW